MSTGTSHSISPAPLAGLPRLLLLRSRVALAVLAAGLGSPAFSQVVTESFTHQERTLLYRYDRGDLARAAGTPGLLLYFHGRSPGTQEEVLDRFHRPAHEFAEEHGLVRVTLASPGLVHGTLGATGTREWHSSDIPVVHEFLQAGLPAQFGFDPSRIVFWGASEGACFLNDFILVRGASYGGGLYAACACFHRDPEQGWDPPADFRTRFRVLVRSSGAGDSRREAAEAYYFYKYRAGLEAFVDSSGEGDGCEPGAVSDSEAIGWLLGTGSLSLSLPGAASETPFPWQRRELSEREPAACEAAAALAGRRGQGDGAAMWVSPGTAGSLAQFEARYRIETVAGSALAGDSGDGGPATAAHLRSPQGVAVDATGNLYVADTENHRVRRVAPDGLIVGVAGAEIPSGDGGPATAARLEKTYGMAVDAAGNLYVAESDLDRVRRIDPEGIITTFAGSGEAGFSGDGGPATAARLSYPTGMAADAAGNLYVADTFNHRVRRIDPAGMITTIAGTGEAGFSGDGGPATAARFAAPTGVAADAAGNLYVADFFNHRVRRIAPDGSISTIAGTGQSGFAGDGGPATAARLNLPYALALDSTGNVYVADRDNHRVRRIGPNGIITTFAGSGEAGFSGDGGPAAAARLNAPQGVAVDAAGNLYVADFLNHRVRRIAPEGSISTIAGTGEAGDSGDGGPATAAQLNRPIGVAVGPAGEVYVADSTNRRVRRIDPAGGMATVAGGYHGGFSGDGGPATAARFNTPRAVAVDAAGNLYVADTFNNRVRRIDPAGVISTIAGTGEAGYSGDGGPAKAARLNVPRAVAVDAAGNLYVADTFNDRVRRIDPAGVISTIAGTGEAGYSGDGGPAKAARLNSPRGIAVDAAGNLYVADTFNNRVRRIDPAGVISTIAGTGEWSYSGDGGPATAARLRSPQGVAVDAAGNVYVVSQSTLRVMRPSWEAVVPLGSTAEPARLDLEGGGSGLVTSEGSPVFSGQALVARDGSRYRLSQRPDGKIIAVGVGAVAPLRVSAGMSRPGTRRIDTLAGIGEASASIPAVPTAVAVDAAGNVYVADGGNDRVWRIDRAGHVSSVAGTGEPGHSGDGGPATAARLHLPTAVAVDAAGNVYVADTRNNRVRQIDPSGVISTIAGTGERGHSGDGGPATAARLHAPTGVAVDAAGNVYVADVENHRVRRIDPAGVVSTIAGTGEQGYSGDGGPATAARLYFPGDVTVDAAGNVYVADIDNNRVRRIDPGGIITTVAGSGPPGHSGDGGPATAAWLHWPHAVAVDAAGNLYVADTLNNRVRRVDPAGVITTLAGSGAEGYAGDGGPATAARLHIPVGVAVDPEGNVYVASSVNRRVRVISGAPYELPVQLGASGETKWLSVSSQGVVTLSGRTVFDGTRVAACNGDVYELHDAADGAILARYVAERQAVGLEGLRPVTLARDESGSWRIGGETVASGHRHARGGREFVLDIAGGRWRLASHTLRTVAGHAGVQDGIPAISARLYAPASVALDSQGNAYVADQANNRIRRIDRTGTITTFAGTGDKGYRGDGGPASEAFLSDPSGVTVDGSGNVYVADTGNHRVRRIDVNGTIETYAGTGVQGYAGDGSPATSALLDTPVALAADATGRVYVADFGNRRVRRIDLAGTIETHAGPGDSADWGDSGPATEARIDGPGGVAVDAAGNVYVADYLGGRVRRIDAAGMISTVGDTAEAGSDGAAADAALRDGPAGVAVDAAGNVYVADYLGERIRRIDPAGVISTLAGTGVAGYGGDGGAAGAALLDGPADVAVDAAGNVYVAERSNHRIRRIDASGTISTVAGTGQPFDRGDGGHASEARFSREIAAVAVDLSGNVYVADPYDHTVRRIDAAETVSTLAGTGEPGFGEDGGPAAEARLDTPIGVAADTAGTVYVADTGNHRVLGIDPAGTIATFAGTGQAGFSGPLVQAANAALNRPERVAVGANGTVYVLDAGNRRVLSVTSPASGIWTVAGNGEQESPRLAGLFAGSDALRVPLVGALDLAVGTSDRGTTALHLALAEPAGPSRLWTVPLPAGRIVERFQGRGGDLGAVAAGSNGRVYFADATAIHEIRPDGSVSTVADLGEYGISVGGLAVDGDGRVWLSDPEARRLRVLEPASQ